MNKLIMANGINSINSTYNYTKINIDHTQDISIQVNHEFTVVTNCMCSLFHLDC